MCVCVCVAATCTVNTPLNQSEGGKRIRAVWVFFIGAFWASAGQFEINDFALRLIPEFQ